MSPETLSMLQLISGPLQSLFVLLTVIVAVWAIWENRKLTARQQDLHKDLAQQNHQSAAEMTQLGGVIAVRTQFVGLREKVVLDRLDAIQAQLGATYGSLERFARSSRNLSRHDLAAGFSEALQSVCDFYSSYARQRTGVPKRFRHHYDAFAEDLVQLVFGLTLKPEDAGRFSVLLSSKESLLLRKLSEHAREFGEVHELLYSDIDFIHFPEQDVITHPRVEQQREPPPSALAGGSPKQRGAFKKGWSSIVSRWIKHQ